MTTDRDPGGLNKEIYIKTEAEKRKNLIALRNKERHKKDLATILAMPEGRRLYWHLLTRCKVHDMSMCKDTHETAFNEGGRKIGLDIFYEMEAVDIGLVNQMRLEEYSRIKSEQAEIEKFGKEDK